MTVSEIISWLETQPSLKDASSSELISFTNELYGKIDQLNFNLPEKTAALGYSGNVKETNAWITVENITENSNGKLGFIV